MWLTVTVKNQLVRDAIVDVTTMTIYCVHLRLPRSHLSCHKIVQPVPHLVTSDNVGINI